MIFDVFLREYSTFLKKKFLHSLSKELGKLGLPWCTPNGTKVNYHLKVQQEMYQAMADGGCYQITLACESGNQRVLNDLINKRFYFSILNN